MAEPDLDSLVAFAGRLADAARIVTVPAFKAGLAIDQKGPAGNRAQPVTEADRNAEQAMRRLIGETYPDHGVLGEEFGHHRPDAEYCWVLDPIDGTRAFIAGFALFGTLIALAHKGRPLIGVIDQPVLDERVIGTPQGTTLNGTPVTTRACRDLDQAVYAMTDHMMMETPAQRAAHQKITERAAVTQYGGNCYAFAMLAAGHVDLACEGDLKPWDVFALVPVIQGAGGVITGWDGGPAWQRSLIVAAGDPALHASLLPLLSGAA